MISMATLMLDHFIYKLENIPLTLYLECFLYTEHFKKIHRFGKKKVDIFLFNVEFHTNHVCMYINNMYMYGCMD